MANNRLVGGDLPSSGGNPAMVPGENGKGSGNWNRKRGTVREMATQKNEKGPPFKSNPGGIYDTVPRAGKNFPKQKPVPLDIRAKHPVSRV